MGFAACITEALSWSFISTDEIDQSHYKTFCVSKVLVVDEVVVCSLCSRDSGSCVVSAWHTWTGARLPQPWHRAAPLDGPSPAAYSPVLLPWSKPLRSLHADPALSWNLACLGVSASL